MVALQSYFNILHDLIFSGVPCTGLSPLEVVSKVRRLSEKLIVVGGDDPLSLEAQRNATILFMSLLRSTLASKRALSEYKLKPEAFDWLIGEIETRFNAVSLYSYTPLYCGPAL